MAEAENKDKGSTLVLTEEDVKAAWNKTKKRCNKEEKILKKSIGGSDAVVQGVSQKVDEEKKTVEFRIKFRGDGLYGDSSFAMKIILPSGYPFQAPANVSFLHDVYHPSVDESTKDICPHVLGIEEWKPTQKLMGIVESMRVAFKGQAAEQYQTKPDEFAKTLKKQLKKKGSKC